MLALCDRFARLGVLFLLAGCITIVPRGPKAPAADRGDAPAVAPSPPTAAAARPDDDPSRVPPPRLLEDRKILGGRKLFVIDPFPSDEDWNGESTPEIVDDHSALRLFFGKPSGDESPSRSEPRYGTGELRARLQGAKERLDELRNRLQVLKAVDWNAPGSSIQSITPQPVAPATGVRDDLAGVADLIEESKALLNRPRVLVEAFRVSGKVQSALSLPDYNEVGSGQTENDPKGKEADKETQDAAKELLKSAESAKKDLDALENAIRGTNRASKPADLTVVQAARASIEPKGAAKPTATYRAFDDLPPTEIDLVANEVKRGDKVKVKVSTVEANEKGEVELGAPRTLIESYVVDVGRIGWHRDDSLAVTMARADSPGGSAESSDDAGDWKLSLAGTVTWSYYNDPDDSKYGSAYDWLQPGFGIHLAALDQTADEVEFGLGAHVSFWEGLLYLGTGTNLSASENHTYWLVGGDIFGWKSKIFGDKNP